MKEKNSMRMKRRLLSLLLSLCMISALMPATVFAAGEEEISVGGIELWGSANDPAYAVTDADGNVTTEGAGEDHYNVMWDGETLILNNATVAPGEDPYEAIDGEGDLRIELKGENKVTGPSDTGYSYGINIYKGCLTIGGDGSLHVTGGDTQSDDGLAGSFGLFATQLIIESGTVTASGGEAVSVDPESYGESAGIWTNKFNLKGGTVVATGCTVNGDNGTSCGLYLKDIDNEVNIEGGVLIAEGGDSEVAGSYGVSIVSGDFNVRGGEATVKGDTAAFDAQNVSAIPPEGKAVLVEAGASEDEISFEDTYMSREPLTEDVDRFPYFHSRTVDRSQISSAIYVGGQGLEGGNGVTAYAVTDKDGAVSTEGASKNYYQIAWDGQTLTLRDATITRGSHWDAAIYYEMGDLTIRLEGTNTVAGPDNVSYSNGLYVLADLTFEGNGSLYAAGGAAQDSGSGADAESYGIEAYGELTIAGGTVTAAGGNTTAEGEESYAGSAGIYAEDVTIIGGAVTATGGNASAEGEESYARSAGIVGGQLTITGGDVTATGGTASAEGEESDAGSNGMDAFEVTIAGGTVTAMGGDAAFYIDLGWTTVNISPQEGQVILAKAGEDESTAGTLAGSPFDSEKEIGETIQEFRYFRSEQIPEGTHVHVGTLVAEREATCTEDGNKAYYTCACGKFFEDEDCTKEITDLDSWKVIPKKGHSWSDDYLKENADAEKHYHVCTECGTKDAGEAHTWNVDAATEETDKHCTICGYVAEEQIVHVHEGTLVAGKEATCTEDGSKAYYTCACGKFFEDESCTIEIADLDSWKVIPKKGHSWSADYLKENADATKHYHVCAECTEKDAGEDHTWNVEAATEETDKHCTICGYVAEEQLGHVHKGTLVAGKDATCTEEGSKAYYTCACGKFFEDEGCTKEITDLNGWKVIPKKAHSWSPDYLKENADAEKHYHICAECGTKDAGEAHTWNVEAATEETDKHCTVCGYVAEAQIGHVHEGTHVAGKDATCTEDGNTEYWYCETCGKYFGDEALTQEITKEATIIRATGHGETELKNKKEATCTAEGYTGDKVCRDCGEVLEKGETVPKLAHSYKDGTCTVCGAPDPEYNPADPSDPTDVDVTNPPSGKGTDGNSPRTGDGGALTLWSILLLASGVSAAAVAVYSRRKKREP